ncbi:MAG TPA: type II toxin-antitoxin system VapC family toxin [Rhizomicrobium sp.]
MRLLLDSQILVAIAHGQAASMPAIYAELQSPTNQMFVSVASLWEIAIKFRLGKLQLPRPPAALSVFFQTLGYQLVVIDQRHAVEDLREQPATRDPFDRLLLAQCQVESLMLVTVDRALSVHPLAWRAP